MLWVLLRKFQWDSFLSIQNTDEETTMIKQWISLYWSMHFIAFKFKHYVILKILTLLHSMWPLWMQSLTGKKMSVT